MESQNRAADVKLKIKNAMAKDMLQFGKVTMPNMFTVASPPFHRDMTKSFLDKDVTKLNIIAPRGHAKSSIAGCVFPIHHIFFDSGPKFIVLCSKTQGHAIDMLQSIKDVLDYSQELRAIFGYYGQHSAKVWTKDRVVLKDNTIIVRNTKAIRMVLTIGMKPFTLK